MIKAGEHVVGFFVNLGASDGIDADPLLRFTRTGVRGVAVEMDSERCAAYRKNFDSTLVTLLCLRLTREALPTVAAAVPIGGYDVLKVDLDSYDCELLWSLLHDFEHRPSCIILEVNTAFPPPFEFSMLHHPAWDEANMTSLPHHLAYGCSLSYAVRLLTRQLPAPRYVLLQMAKKDALFLREDVAERLLGTKADPDEFACYQVNLVESRAVETSRLREWFFGSDLEGTLDEMRTLVRSDLISVLGEAAGSQAQFHLEVQEPRKDDRSSQPRHREFGSLFALVREAGRHYLAFRDLLN